MGARTSRGSIPKFVVNNSIEFEGFEGHSIILSASTSIYTIGGDRWTSARTVHVLAHPVGRQRQYLLLYSLVLAIDCDIWDCVPSAQRAEPCHCYSGPYLMGHCMGHMPSHPLACT